MKELVLLPRESISSSKTYTLRDVIAIGARHRRIALISLFGIVLGAVAAAIFMPKYQSEMEVIVKRGRMDPVLTAEPDPRPEMTQEITEEEMNSEAEMIQSGDILDRAVTMTGLDKLEYSLFSKLTPEEQVQLAARRLAKHLDVSLVKKTNVIKVVYGSRDPERAAKVVKALASLYLEKHAAVQRPAGQSAFFEQQVSDAQKALEESETQLARFTKDSNVVAPMQARDLAVQKMAEFSSAAQQARASAAETQSRINSLERLAHSVPPRITTQLKTADNPMLLQQMKSKLLSQQLQRTELLAKYQPSYRLVTDLDREIAETQKEIAAEESSPVKEEVTDQNLTHQWVLSELAKGRADLSTYQAQIAASDQIVRRYEQVAQQLEQRSREQQDLTRAVKVREDNFLLYKRKLEEARISDALDKERMLNVAMVEAPTSPVLPAHPALVYAALGAILACMLSVFAMFTAEYMDSSFRTPDELRSYLNVPVLAALPQSE